MTASSSASWSRFRPPSNFVNGHASTMWFVVCRWPQSQEGDWARPHFCKLPRHGPDLSENGSSDAPQRQPYSLTPTPLTPDVNRQLFLHEQFAVHKRKQLIAPGAAKRYAPADGSSTRGVSTSVRGRVRSPHMAQLQTASASIA